MSYGLNLALLTLLWHLLLLSGFSLCSRRDFGAKHLAPSKSLQRFFSACRSHLWLCSPTIIVYALNKYMIVNVTELLWKRQLCMFTWPHIYLIAISEITCNNIRKLYQISSFGIIHHMISFKTITMGFIQNNAQKYMIKWKIPRCLNV